MTEVLSGAARLLALILLLAAAATRAAPPEALVPQAEAVGHGRMSVFFVDLYDAVLYAPGGEWRGAAPFALSLTYLRAIEGGTIADHSVREMRRQGFGDEILLAAWHRQLEEIFPDVEAGTTLTGVSLGGESVFLQDGREIGRIRDPRFTRRFFDIWLGAGTRSPELRRRLLGAP